MKDYFRDKVVFITGASSGIGADLAELLAGWGARVAVCARRRDALDGLCERCRGAGREVVAFPGDVTDAARMAQIRDELIERFGRVDIVVANAGVGGLNPGERFDLDLHRRTVEINVMGLANTLAPFIPHMVERREGQLVGVSSLAGFRGLPCAASYSSTKSQQWVFLESLRVDLRRWGVAVTSIHPGFVETPMTGHDEFPMPFKMPVRRSSLLIARAIRRRRATYLYPWPMKLLTWVNRLLPPWLFDRLLPRLSGHRDPRPRML